MIICVVNSARHCARCILLAQLPKGTTFSIYQKIVMSSLQNTHGDDDAMILENGVFIYLLTFFSSMNKAHDYF